MYKFLKKQPAFSVEAIFNKYDIENNCKKYALDFLLGLVFTQRNENSKVKKFFEKQNTTLYEQTNRIKAFLSDSFVDFGTKIKGIMYPSVQSEYFSMCCCCSDKVFEQTFSYYSGDVYEVIDVDGEDIYLQFVFEGKREEDRVNWESVREKNMFWKLRADSEMYIRYLE